jgi:hypothetical protein
VPVKKATLPLPVTTDTSTFLIFFSKVFEFRCRARWPHGLRRMSWPLGCWDRRFEFCWGAWILSLCLYILLSYVGRDLCDELIPHPKEFYPVSNKIQSPNERHRKKSINVLTRKIELMYITMFLIILSINWDLVNVGSLNLNLPLQIWLRSLILLPL